MALSEQNTTQSEKPQDGNKYDSKKEKPLTKVVIRRLPPSMTQDEFLNQVSPVPDYDYIYAVKGDIALGENAFSRVYINFCNTEDIYIFKEKFDNYVFVDNKGHEYPAVVEYAAFQKVLKRRKPRPDHKKNTIDTDPTFLEFLEKLKEQPTQEEKPEYSFQPASDNKTEDITTPLLDYLKQRKIDRLRIKEEKREERRKRELERKKLRDDDRRRRLEEKNTKKNSPTVKETSEDSKQESNTTNKEKSTNDYKDDEKHGHDKYYDKYSKYRDRRYDDRKMKPKYKYDDRKEYKGGKRDEYYSRNKYEDSKRYEHVEYSKKVKKYSERREERRSEKEEKDKKHEEVKPEKQNDEAVKEKVEKKEEKKQNESNKEKEKEKEREDIKVESNDDRDDSKVASNEEMEYKGKNKDGIPKRIRNKDRPPMPLYKPGMLRKKSIDSNKEKDSKDGDKTKSDE